MLGERGYFSIYETETYNKQVYSGNEFESPRDMESYSFFPMLSLPSNELFPTQEIQPANQHQESPTFFGVTGN
jgi:hypothetical protein